MIHIKKYMEEVLLLKPMGEVKLMAAVKDTQALVVIGDYNFEITVDYKDYIDWIDKKVSFDNVNECGREF